MKKVGFRQSQLLTTYKTYIRCFLEYNSPVWGKSLPNKLVNKIEAAEKRALSTIMGYRINRTNYKKTCLTLKITDISERRNQLLYKFSKKLSTSNRYKNWIHKFKKEEPRYYLRTVHPYELDLYQ